MTTLIGIDLDGTLTVPFTNTLAPGVLNALAALRAQPTVRIVGITNQGSALCSVVTGGDPRYDTPEQVAQNIYRVARAAGLLDIPWYINTAAARMREHATERQRSRSADRVEHRLRSLCPIPLSLDVSGAEADRKPNPGMLIRAAQTIGPVTHRIYIGDRSTDADAAHAAGWAFCSASTWLGPGLQNDRTDRIFVAPLMPATTPSTQARVTRAIEALSAWQLSVIKTFIANGRHMQARRSVRRWISASVLTAFEIVAAIDAREDIPQVDLETATSLENALSEAEDMTARVHERLGLSLPAALAGPDQRNGVDRSDGQHGGNPHVPDLSED